MKRLTVGFILVFIACSMQACAQTTEKAYHVMLKGLYKQSVPVMKVEELNNKLSKSTATKPLLLDTRTLAEYEVSHISGARHIEPDNFTLSQIKDISKSTPIIVYCSVGYRSERVGEQLQKAGYKNVHNLYGGIFEWVNRGYPIYTEGAQTNKVHAYSRSWGIWLTKGEKIYE